MNILASLAGGQIGAAELAVGGLFVVGVILLLVAVFSGSGSRRLMSRRISRIKADHEKRATASEVLNARREAKKSSTFDEVAKSVLPQQDILRMRLSRAGLEMSLGTYFLICLVAAAVAFLLAKNFLGFPAPAALLFGLFCGIGLPHMVIGFQIKRRTNKFITHFPDAIDLMVRGVKAGLPIAESMKTAGEEIPDPVGLELRRMTDSIRLGRKLDEVLVEASKRLDLQDFTFFTIALSIQSETGGNLAETLENLSDVLRGRRQLKRKIKALSSEAKASAYIIGSLPFIMTGLIYMVNSGYIVGLFMDPRGQFMIGFGLLMIAAGVGVMYKMVKFEI